MAYKTALLNEPNIEPSAPIYVVILTPRTLIGHFCWALTSKSCLPTTTADLVSTYSFLMMLLITGLLGANLHLDGSRATIALNVLELLGCTVLGVAVQMQKRNVFGQPVQTWMSLLFMIHGLDVAVYCSDILGASGSQFWLVATGLLLKSALYMFGTSIAFSFKAAASTWFLWLAEIMDIVTLLFGYAAVTDEQGAYVRWAYFGIAFVTLVGFAHVSAYLLGDVMYKDAEEGIVTAVWSVWVLDIMTDIPALVLTLAYKSYVNNMGLTLNMLLNGLVLARVLALLVANDK